MFSFKRMALFLISVSFASFSQWSGAGLDGIYCNKVKLVNNFLYAATNDGIYRRPANETSAQWTPIGPNETVVLDFIVFSNQEIMLCKQLYTNMDRSDTLSIYRTLDGGQSWKTYQNGFGGPLGGYYGLNQCKMLEIDPAKPDTLYSRGSYVVAKSVDRGMSWQTIYPEKGNEQEHWGSIGYQSTIMQIDPYREGVIWAGGEALAFSGYLLKSMDLGDTWELYGHNDFFEENPGDNAVYCVTPSPENPQHLLIGMEGYIFKSDDDGASWSLSLESPTHTYVIDMETSATITDRVYASGSVNGTHDGPLFFYVSDNFGGGWEKTVAPIEGAYTCNDLLVLENDGVDQLIFATDRGMYSYIEPASSARLAKNGHKAPMRTLSAIKFIGNPLTIPVSYENRSVTIYSMDGKEIHRFSPTRASIPWNGAMSNGSLAPHGIYLVKAQ